jgi:uncharacterized protein (DUF1778 family)
VTDFERWTTTERAEEILVERRCFVASLEAWDEFLEVLANPPAPSPTLIRLFRDSDL